MQPPNNQNLQGGVVVKRFNLLKIMTKVVLAALLFIPTTGLAQEQLRVAFSIPGFVFPFFLITESGAQAEAEALGNVEIISLDGQDSDAIQLSTAEDAVAAGIDGMVISPRTTEGLASLFELLEEQNIPVVTFDRRAIEGSEILGHIGADNVAGGEQAGKFIAEALGGEGRVIELLGTPGASPAIDRSAGFNAAIAEFPGIERVAQQTANFNAADGLTVTEDILTSLGSTPDNPGFDALFAANDEMVLGAIEAIRARGLNPGDFVMVGFDAAETALDAIKDGALSGTVDQFPNEQAGTAVRQVVEFLRDGTEPPLATFLTPRVISIDNIDEASTLILAD
jgi:ribose transport system substrate-binding protein